MNNPIFNACIATGIICLIVGMLIGCWIMFVMENRADKKEGIVRSFDENKQLPKVN